MVLKSVQKRWRVNEVNWDIVTYHLFGTTWLNTPGVLCILWPQLLSGWLPIWGNLYYYSMVSLYPHYLSLACCRWVTISQFTSLTLHLFCTDLRTILWCNTTHSNLISMSMEPSVSFMSLHGVTKRLGQGLTTFFIDSLIIWTVAKYL